MRSDEHDRRRRWSAAIVAHRQALESYLATADAIAPQQWNLPRAAGKWSPAQITEHLRLTYETVLAELGQRGGFRVRARGLRLLVLRWLVMPRILRRRAFPRGAPATREVRPGDGPFDQQVGVAALRAAGEACLGALEPRDPAGRGFTHPFFGVMAPLAGLELATIHVQHHHAQIAALVPPAAATADGDRP